MNSTRVPGRVRGPVALFALVLLIAAFAACASSPDARAARVPDSASAGSLAYARADAENQPFALENRVSEEESEEEPDEPAAPEPEPEPEPVVPPVGTELPMDLAQPPADALSSPSGMSYVVLAPPTRRGKPGRFDMVDVTYAGWLTKGEIFYTTTRKHRPDRIAVDHMAKGWQEAIMDMQEGERRIYWMPDTMTVKYFQTVSSDPILVFDIQVDGIHRAPSRPAGSDAPPGNTRRLRSGVRYRVAEPGTGATRPRSWDRVRFEYRLWDGTGHLIAGTWSSQRARIAHLYQHSVWWSDVVQTMVQGQVTWAWVPEKLRTDQHLADYPGDVFATLKLVGMTRMSRPPPVPKDVAKPPRRARKSPGGVPYRVLKRGRGKSRPTAEDKVKVHYTGWTTDGKMFDSSVTRGNPAIFRLNRVIKGWTDVVQTMVVGRKIRVWIPEEMAYRGKPGRPQGVLVFDIELLEIVR